MTRSINWTVFRRTLARMGAVLEASRNPDGTMKPAAEARMHPLVQIVAGARDVIAAIGEVVAADDEQRGVLSWANVSQAHGGTTVRLNHKGTKERCQEALDAAIGAIRRAGRRVSYHDLIRHENQNGYLMLLRVPDAPNRTLGFAR